MKKQEKQKILLGLLLVVFLFFAYNTFIKEPSFDSALSISSASQINSDVGREIISTLNKLQTIQIDPAFFDSDQFNSLINFNVELSPEPIGKDDPFTTSQESNVVTQDDDEIIALPEDQ